MDDGRIKVLLSVSSLNLSLKSEEEQSAIIAQFQGFLNTLDFPIQIHAESRRVDMRPYLESLDKRQEDITDDLLRNQLKEYRNFIKTFSDKTNIMSKRFFVIIDYDHGEKTESGTKSEGVLGSFFGKKKDTEYNPVEIEEWKTQLEQRISIVAGGLSSIGLSVNLLSTEELIELYYKIYNPALEAKSAEMTA